jgi:hypothetical protein
LKKRGISYPLAGTALQYPASFIAITIAPEKEEYEDPMDFQWGLLNMREHLMPLFRIRQPVFFYFSACCPLFFIRPFLKKYGNSPIRATENIVLLHDLNHSYAPGDFIFGLSPPLWRPQIAIERTQ